MIHPGKSGNDTPKSVLKKGDGLAVYNELAEAYVKEGLPHIIAFPKYIKPYKVLMVLDVIVLAFGSTICQYGCYE